MQIYNEGVDSQVHGLYTEESVRFKYNKPVKVLR